MNDEIRFSGPSKIWLELARKALYEFDREICDGEVKERQSLVVQAFIAEKFKR